MFKGWVVAIDAVFSVFGIDVRVSEVFRIDVKIVSSWTV
jgi:hypothetical protein